MYCVGQSNLDNSFIFAKNAHIPWDSVLKQNKQQTKTTLCCLASAPTVFVLTAPVCSSSLHGG